MSKVPPLAALPLILGLALPAAAQDRVARMENLTEALQDKMIASMKAEYPSLQGQQFDMDWTPETREAAACTLDYYDGRIAPARLDAMFDQMEALLAREGTDFQTLAAQMQNVGSDLPDGIAQEANRQCGLIDAQTRLMQDSGMMGAMMQAMRAKGQN